MHSKNTFSPKTIKLTLINNLATNVTPKIVTLLKIKWYLQGEPIERVQKKGLAVVLLQRWLVVVIV